MDNLERSKGKYPKSDKTFHNALEYFAITTGLNGWVKCSTKAFLKVPISKDK